ncbi:hypothetical protein CF8_0239 [Aeromonas phage CF8]|nr:hypothetical protein CF8_0239 [Aeromonas phage CF8]
MKLFLFVLAMFSIGMVKASDTALVEIQVDKLQGGTSLMIGMEAEDRSIQALGFSCIKATELYDNQYALTYVLKDLNNQPVKAGIDSFKVYRVDTGEKTFGLTPEKKVLLFDSKVDTSLRNFTQRLTYQPKESFIYFELHNSTTDETIYTKRLSSKSIAMQSLKYDLSDCADVLPSVSDWGPH